MSDAAIGSAIVSAVWYFGCFLVGVAICRWAFRINHIIERLDRIDTRLASAYPVKEETPKAPTETVKMTLGEPYIPSANRFPRED